MDAESGVLANDVGTGGGAAPLFPAVLVESTSNGTLVFEEDGSFVFTPDADFHGEDGFRYRVVDAVGTSFEEDVTLTVLPVDDAPVAAADAYETSEDTTLTVDAGNGVLVNDADPDGDPLASSLVDGPAHGSVSLAADGSFDYTPDADFHGTDSFTYRAEDPGGLTSIATVELTVASVNDAPRAVADPYTAAEDTTLAVTASFGLLVNDTDVEGDTLVSRLVAGPSHGTVDVAADGSFLYTPDANFHGVDSFTYRAEDPDGLASTATVELTVSSVDDPPAAAEDGYVLDEDTPLVVAAAEGLLANDIDPDGDAIAASLVSGPDHGTVQVGTDGSFEYTPDADFNGTDRFRYRVVDETGLASEADVTLRVLPVNDTPTAQGEAYGTAEDVRLAVGSSAGLLVNDSDVEGDALVSRLVTEAEHGSVNLAADGSFFYTPDADFHGVDSFTYRAEDPGGRISIATVELTVSSVNDAPEAVADEYDAAEDTPLVVGAAEGLLTNDSDVDGDALAASLVTGPDHGTVVVGADGSFEYTPDADFNGVDSFVYRAVDGFGAASEAQVSLTVAAAPDAPEAAADAYGTLKNTTLSVVGERGVLVNDADGDGDALRSTLVTDAAHGSVNLAADGSFVYTPDSNFEGDDSFTYRAEDPGGRTSTATVQLRVSAVNGPPEAEADEHNATEDTPLLVTAAGGLLANDADPDGDALVASLVTGPDHGTVEVGPDGSFEYTPDADFNGEDRFRYRVADVFDAASEAEVTLTVAAVNDAPRAEPLADLDGLDGEAVALEFATAFEEVDGDALTFRAAGLPAGLTMDADTGRVSGVIDRAASAGGTHAVVLTAEDSTGASTDSGFSWRVTNPAPVAVDDVAETSAGVAMEADVMLNDSDPDGDAIRVTSAVAQFGGVEVLASGQLRYSPAGGFVGVDSVNYVMADADGAEASAVLRVTVAAAGPVDPLPPRNPADPGEPSAPVNPTAREQSVIHGRDDLRRHDRRRTGDATTRIGRHARRFHPAAGGPAGAGRSKRSSSCRRSRACSWAFGR